MAQPVIFARDSAASLLSQKSSMSVRPPTILS